VPADDSSPQALIKKFKLGEDDLAAWEQSGREENAFLDWLTDRLARRPTGARARQVYGDETVHDFVRRAILDALALGPQDRLLEIGCGGGLLLRDALATGAAVTGIDHSAEMVALAQERAPAATVLEASAQALSFDQSTFTAIAMSVVFFFLPDPVAALKECARVLEHGGRLAVYTTAPELCGTPAAPEPIASLGHFHSDQDLMRFAGKPASSKSPSQTTVAANY
jgi:ubiquinone/menaquinone biosynthesis C-methylase UbiE